MTRDIQDILNFRTDISPFLVHLTRDNNGKRAKEILEKIIKDRRLECGETLVSDAQWAVKSLRLNGKSKYFKAVCFSDTPLNEIHCLFEIKGRKFDLKPYGLVFVKDHLATKGVSPVLYINNKTRDKTWAKSMLRSLIKDCNSEVKDLLPLIATFGTQLKRSRKPNDFRWEREWRYPCVWCPLEFKEEDVFIGLCPNIYIEHFETTSKTGLKFIDPRRNIKWYAKKLIDSRERWNKKHNEELHLNCSVV